MQDEDKAAQSPNANKMIKLIDQSHGIERCDSGVDAEPADPEARPESFHDK